MCTVEILSSLPLKERVLYVIGSVCLAVYRTYPIWIIFFHKMWSNQASILLKDGLDPDLDLESGVVFVFSGNPPRPGFVRSKTLLLYITIICGKSNLIIGKNTVRIRVK